MSAPGPSPRSELIGGTLAGRFTIERSLGSGGMGEVFLATDTTLRRRVAIKRVAARFRGDQEHRKQLLREAERCSSLNHPNVATIFDVLQDDATGELVIVMEYVDGVTLRPSIGTPVDAETFFRVALSCAEAMAAAHQQGIVHGDLKPENIMLARNQARVSSTFASVQSEVFADSGMVKVLDFGLAIHSTAQPQEPTVSRDEFDANIRGTIGYMAPEVLRGQRPSEAADVFALGVIFHELLTGQHPFMAATNAITLDRTLHYDPKITAACAGGEQVAAILQKMLAKAVSARYKNARAVLEDLQAAANDKPVVRRPMRWLGYAALAIAIAAGAVAWRYASHRRTISQYQLIAVLPFRPLGGQASLQALGEGLTETASAKLARIADAEGLQLVAPADARKIHGSADEAIEAARRDLGVDLAFVPSMEQSGNRVRINFRLIDTASRREIDGDSVVAAADDVFALEDRAVESMAALLDLKVRSHEREQLQQHGTASREAYQQYLEGVGYLRGYDDPKNVANAIAAFQKALTSDPNYGLAYAGTGRAYWQQYEQSRDVTLVEKARDACSKAVNFARAQAPPHVCLGTVDNGTGQYEIAVREFALASSIDKNDDDAVRGLALALEKLDRPGEAEATFKRAIELRPQYWAGYTWLAAFYKREARYADAAQQYQLASEHAPQNGIIFRSIGGIYIYTGDYSRAEQALNRSIELTPRQFEAYSNLGVVYLRQRRFADAIRMFETAQANGAENYRIWGNLADAYYWAAGKREISKDRYRKAISLATDVLQVNRNDHEAHLLIAHYYAAIGNRPDALSNLQDAMAAQKQDQEVYYYAALVHNELGDTSEAITWLKAALAHGYSAAEVRGDVWVDNLRGDPEFQKLLAQK
jgi:tetratricopeptide (TPR) repeat protein/tRNA A-37 threonylcarbamoyl transferase component Bud32